MGQFSKHRSIIALNLSREHSVKPIDFVAAFFAEILPDIKRISKDEDVSAFKDALELGRIISQRIKKHSYSRHALISLIKTEFLNSMKISDLRAMIGDTPFCMFPDDEGRGMIFKSVSNNPPALRSDYGDEEYLPDPYGVIMGQVDSSPEDQNTIIKRKCRTPKEKLLTEDETINKALERLYSDVIKKEWPKYEWQLSLSLLDYETIKTGIKHLDYIPPASHLSINAQRILAVYIAEFYKREYAGKGLNAMSSINKEWKRNIVDPEKLQVPLYKKSNNALLYSLYVNGGLPIHYIMTQLINGNNNSALVRFLKGLADEDEIERELAFVSLPAQARNVLLNNTALRESIGNQESLYRQIEQLKKESYLFNEEDLNDTGQPFSSFIRFFKEARIEVEKSKTRLSYEIWYDKATGVMSLRPLVRFSSTKNEEQNFSLSTIRLAQWGIPSSEMPDSLTLSFEKSGELIPISDLRGNMNEQICFVHCSNDEFVEFAGRSCFSLPVIRSNEPDFCWRKILLTDYDVMYSDNTGHSFAIKDHILPDKKEPYYLLYSDDGIIWFTQKGNRAYKSAALLYNTSECQPCSGGFVHISPEVGWVQFEHSIRIRVKNKEVILYNGVGRVYAKPADSCLHNILNKGQIIVPDDGLLRYELNGDNRFVYLVKAGTVKFELFRTDNSDQIKTELFVYEITGEEEKPVSESCEIEPGFHSFRVSFDNRHYAVVYCFALPEQASVNIDNRSHLVQFYSTGMGVECADSSTSIRMSNDRCSIADINEDSDCIHFSIVDQDGGRLKVETYYPFDQTIFKTGDIYIKACGKGKNALPVVFNSRCEMVRISSSNSLTREFVDEHSSKIYSYLLSTNLDVIQASGEKGTKAGNVNFVAYSQDFQPSERQYTVLTGKKVEESVSHYHFCFFDLESNQITQIEPNVSGPDQRGLYKAVIDLSSFNNQGILFQSLDHDECAPRYFRPIFVPRKGENNPMPRAEVRRNNKKKTIDRFVTERAFCEEAAMFAFETAAKHSTYFSTFDILLSLISETGIDNGNDIARRLVLFLKAYLEHCGRQGHQPDYRALWRLSEEFVFDWLVIPKRIYLDYKLPMEDLLVLFKHKPGVSGDDRKAYDAFLSRYQGLPSSLSTRSRKAAETIYSSITGPNSMFLRGATKQLYENRGRILDIMREERFVDIICNLQ